MKKIFYKLVKKIFNEEITKLSDETNFDDLTNPYKNMSRKRFNDFNNIIKLFLK